MTDAPDERVPAREMIEVHADAGGRRGAGQCSCRGARRAHPAGKVVDKVLGIIQRQQADNRLQHIP